MKFSPEGIVFKCQLSHEEHATARCCTDATEESSKKDKSRCTARKLNKMLDEYYAKITQADIDARKHKFETGDKVHCVGRDKVYTFYMYGIGSIAIVNVLGDKLTDKVCIVMGNKATLHLIPESLLVPCEHHKAD